MANQVITLITGPNRGIGRGLLEVFLGQANNTVIAAVRDPTATISQGLKSIPVGEGSKVILVKIDSAVDSDAQKAVSELKSSYGIEKLDVVISNAGIGEVATTVSETPPASIRSHMDVNLIGTLTLFQAVEPLLRKSQEPKFFTMSSNLASLGLMEYVPGPWFCYGVTKSALNFLTRKIHFENEWLTAAVLSPGWVQTDMGEFAAKAVVAEAAPVKLEDSIKGLVQVIEEASRNTTSGTSISYEKQSVPW